MIELELYDCPYPTYDVSEFDKQVLAAAYSLLILTECLLNWFYRTYTYERPNITLPLPNARSDPTR